MFSPCLESFVSLRQILAQTIATTVDKAHVRQQRLARADAKRLAAFDTLIWDAELGRVFGHEHYQHAVVSLSRSSELYELATG